MTKSEGELCRKEFERRWANIRLVVPEYMPLFLQLEPVLKNMAFGIWEGAVEWQQARTQHEASIGIKTGINDTIPIPIETSEIRLPDEAKIHDELWDAVSGLHITHGEDVKRLKAKVSLHEIRMLIQAFVEVIKPYLRTTEPVSVSLEKCAEAINYMPGIFYSDKASFHEIAKAVLDAAGVKYGD